MDRKTLTREQAIDTVREYKRVIRPRYHAEPKVMMYGSYADEKIFLIFLIIRFSGLVFFRLDRSAVDFEDFED